MVSVDVKHHIYLLASLLLWSLVVPVVPVCWWYRSVGGTDWWYRSVARSWTRHAHTWGPILSSELLTGFVVAEVAAVVVGGTRGLSCVTTLSHRIVTSKNTKTWAVLQHIDTSTNGKA